MSRRKKKAPTPVPRIKKHTEIRNVVVISDTHVGCKMALCHPDGATLDDGGTYFPSKIQQKIWDHWEEFWGEWVPRATRKEPYAVVHNGDCIEGQHHQATTPWSANLSDQTNHAYLILKPVVEACEGRYYHIRGTEAHVGKSAREAEDLARRLGAVPNEEGQHSRWDLWLRVAGKLCNFLHHIGTTSSAQHEASAVNAEMASIYMEAGRWGDEPPLVVARSHRHTNIEVRLPNEDGQVSVFTTAAWQLKTPHCWKIAGARNKQPQLGGSLIRMGDEEFHTRHKVWRMQRSREVSLV